jgi:hypothetical protein
VIENGAVTVLLLTCGLLAFASQAEQGPIDRRELSTYRLTTSFFERFRDASQRIAIVIVRDPSFRADPLFSQKIVQSGDVTEVSATLEARLRDHPGLAHALSAATISARDYTKFALTLVAARLALGFVESGVLKTVPPGAATENVAFVRRHQAAVDDLFTELGIEIWRPPPNPAGLQPRDVRAPSMVRAPLLDPRWHCATAPAVQRPDRLVLRDVEESGARSAR